LFDSEFQHGAVIVWGRETELLQLQQVSIWVTEFFGLPGHRYVVDINISDMTFWFRDQQDRMLFVLRNGTAQCIQLS